MGANRLGQHLALALTLPLVGAAPPDRALDASVSRLRDAVVPRDDGSNLVMLASLRQLRDPTLRSFYLQLAQHGDPMSRIHAILGLAEIDPDGRIDPWLVSQLDAPEARYAVIDNAIQLDLIDTPQIKELLGWNDLEARSRVLLMAELLERAEPLDQSALAELAEDQWLQVAGLASCLLAQVGQRAAFDAFRARVAASDNPQRTLTLGELFAAIRIYRLTAVLSWVEQLIEAPDAEPALVASGLATLLVLDPPHGAALWAETLGSSPSYTRCVRYGLLLLSSGPAVPAETYDLLPRGDPLLDAMADAGRTIASGRDGASAMIELVDLGHPSATAWVVKSAEDLDPQQATRVYGHLIDRADPGGEGGGSAGPDVSFIAAARLFEINPDAVIERLHRAPDDGRVQRAILTGLLDSRSPAAGEVARPVPRLGFGPNDSLAVLLIAKHAQRLDADELRQLGVIASGGGQLTRPLEAQAAWLYLKHRGILEPALADVFAGTGSPRGSPQ